MGEVTRQQYGSIQAVMDRQPVLYCLKGRLKVGENFAKFEIDQGCISAGVYQIKIDFLTFCSNDDHTKHFAAPPTAQYPTGNDGYQDEIEIRVPRPMPLVHR